MIAVTAASTALCIAGTGIVAVIAITFISKTAVDALGSVMMVLVTTLGWIITRYSRNYLEGERQQRRYITALFFTLMSICVVVLAQRLDVLTLAWIASSLGLHQLLTFYDTRSAALMAAHKKFIASRAADLCMIAALLLLYHSLGSLSFADINACVAMSHDCPVAMRAAMLLVALAVILKSAQLPVHGWLIQVMEAPTPVSALLHAGVVNIGGFVLIRLANLLDHAFAARAVLVVTGTITAVLASLVMLTRISIKVRLAWSTCAQMGFMLMECGLGLYDLALLHLLAHSFYKAYAFLSAGDTVLITRRDQLFAPKAATPIRSLITRLSAAPLSMAIAGAFVMLWQLAMPDLRIQWIVLCITGLGLAPLLWSAEDGSWRNTSYGVALQVMIVNLYLLWHCLFARYLIAPNPQISGWAPAAAACFVFLYAVQCWLVCFPHLSMARYWYSRAYAGFYLDELFTRFTFVLWPPRLNAANQAGAIFRFSKPLSKVS